MHDFRLFIIELFIIVAILVFGIMLYSVIIHHHSTDGQEENRFHQSIVTEIIWTMIPILIFISMMIPVINMVFGKFAE